MALFSVDDQMNISIARGYTVNIPVIIRRADDSAYSMIPGKDTLKFTVKHSINDATVLIQKISGSASISLAASDTVSLLFGAYVYDLVLTHTENGQSWVETVLGPCTFNVGGDDDDLLDNYRRLLTSEYRTRPRLTKWLLWLLSDGISYRSTFSELINAFNLDEAIGAQLDVLGSIVGVNRLLNFYPSGGESPLLDDDTYRVIIKAVILKNVWKGTLDELYEAWAVLFPDVVLQIQDNQDMTFNVVIMGAFTSLMRELITNGYIIPKPEGVRINIMTITDTTGLPLFAYDLDTYQYSGYTAHWATLS